MKSINKKKIVYVAISADIIHHGHINILKKAARYGNVIVGLLNDSAISSYKQLPLLEFNQRKEIIKSISYVYRVVEQKTLDYEKNLNKYKPDFVVHGDDWKTGFLSKQREKVQKILKKWNGTLIEPKYTIDVSSKNLVKEIQNVGTTPQARINRLRRLINSKEIVRTLQVHDGISALIAEKVNIKSKEKIIEFDALWDSSLTTSTSKGKPDIELVDLSSRINSVNEVIEVSTKPIIFDGDTGGLKEHFSYNVKSLERLGVGAVIIEDKEGLKKNSLLGNTVKQTQTDPKVFAEKILAGKRAQVTDDFMIIARIESLILDRPIKEALERAKIYLNNGADGIMIHSKDKSPNEILKFCDKYYSIGLSAPLVCVPTTYDQIYEQKLIESGIKVVIYANHMLRAAYKPMYDAAKSILKHSRAKEASEKYCISVNEILNLIPGTK